MSQYVETGKRHFIAGAALARYLRVKLSAGKLAAAGASDVSIGTLETAAFADGDERAVRLRTAEGTCCMVASEAITAGDPVYAAASGKVASTGSVYEGTALTASGANNDVIEVLRGPNTDVSAAITGTNAVGFEVDADSSTPKIKLQAQSGGTGDYTTTLQPESTLSADNAITVPEADGDTLVAAALAQTLSNKTIAGLIATNTLNLEVGTVAATGSVQGDAAALGSAAIVHVVTAGDDTKGVVLPTAAAGDVKLILNSGSAGLKVYPNTDDKINNGSADTAVAILENTAALLVATAADNWLMIFTPNS